MNLPVERVMSAHTRVRADARLALAELTFKTGACITRDCPLYQWFRQYDSVLFFSLLSLSLSFSLPRIRAWPKLTRVSVCHLVWLRILVTLALLKSRPIIAQPLESVESRARTVAAVAAILYDASGTRIGGGVLFPSVINDIDEFAASTWSSESNGDGEKTKSVTAYIYTFVNKPRHSGKIWGGWRSYGFPCAKIRARDRIEVARPGLDVCSPGYHPRAHDFNKPDVNGWPLPFVVKVSGRARRFLNIAS